MRPPDDLVPTSSRPRPDGGFVPSKATPSSTSSPRPFKGRGKGRGRGDELTSSPSSSRQLALGECFCLVDLVDAGEHAAGCPSRGDAVTGAELQAAIVEAAHVLGWRVAHFRPARTAHGWRTPVAADGAGWPDLTLVRERIVFAEAKGASDRLRPEQAEWLHALSSAGAEAHVWTPEAWTAGQVEAVLR